MYPIPSTLIYITSKESSVVNLAGSQHATNSMAGYLPPGAYVISQRSGDTIHVTADMLRANTIATTLGGELAGHAAEVQAQLFIKDNSNCKISV